MTILYKILDSQLCARGHIIGASCLLNDHFGLELYFEDYLIEEIAELFFVIAHSFFMNVGMNEGGFILSKIFGYLVVCFCAFC